MPWPEVSGASGMADESSPRVLLASDRARGGEIETLLEARRYRVQPVATPEEAAQAFRESRPALLIMTEPGASADGAWAELRKGVRTAGIPILGVAEDGSDLDVLIARSGAAHDWVVRSRLASELPSRAERLIRHTPNGHAEEPINRMAPLDSHFIALLVHDLRTPLNVVGLSLRMIDQAISKRCPDVKEDLRFVEENFKQMERMLAQLSDYYRLFETELVLDDAEFSPRRMLDELLESRKARVGAKTAPARADIHQSCPESVVLDPIRARSAIEYALVNASAAAAGGPVRVVLRGAADRWITEVRLDQPPPSSVRSHDLHPQRFERLCGTAAERRGMELAIAARVTHLFGGSARLDVEDGKGTAIILDWPTSRLRA
jgi:signal transduction histidine kinase